MGRGQDKIAGMDSETVSRTLQPEIDFHPIFRGNSVYSSYRKHLAGFMSRCRKERLEMLSEAGLHQRIEEARKIMESARSQRPEVSTTLPKNCQRVKVARLCVCWAEEFRLAVGSRTKPGGGKQARAQSLVCSP